MQAYLSNRSLEVRLELHLFTRNFDSQPEPRDLNLKAWLRALTQTQTLEVES